MTCVIDEKTTTIVRKEGYWLIGGKLKVKDLSECTFTKTPQNRRISIGSTDDIPKKPHPPQDPPQSPPSIQPKAGAPMEALIQSTGVATGDGDFNINAIKDIADDSVWGGVAIMALILVSKFLNRYFDLQAQQSKSTDDISKQCETRHSANTEQTQAVIKKLDSVDKSVSDLEKRLATLEIESRYMNPAPPRRGGFDDEPPRQDRAIRPPRDIDRDGRGGRS